MDNSAYTDSCCDNRVLALSVAATDTFHLITLYAFAVIQRMLVAATATDAGTVVVTLSIVRILSFMLPHNCSSNIYSKLISILNLWVFSFFFFFAFYRHRCRCHGHSGSLALRRRWIFHYFNSAKLSVRGVHTQNRICRRPNYRNLIYAKR